MPPVRPGATITPGFAELLPPWAARQPWYRGRGVPALRLVGTFRLVDPAGQVGIETHLLADGPDLYQIPMTYRGAPLAGAAGALIATAQHSILGPRWIYDAEADPVWAAELIRLVRAQEAARPGRAQARGRRLVPRDLPGAVTIGICRVVTPGPADPGPGVVGLVTGTWHPEGPGTPAVSGTLAVLRAGPAVHRAGPRPAG
jgi:hypothetical protein